MIVGDIVWGWCQLLVSFVIRIHLLWLMKLSWMGFMTTEFLLEDLSLGNKGCQGKPLPASAVFQVFSAQNNQCTKVSYFQVACPKVLKELKALNSQRENSFILSADPRRVVFCLFLPSSAVIIKRCLPQPGEGNNSFSVGSLLTLT